MKRIYPLFTLLFVLSIMVQAQSQTKVFADKKHSFIKYSMNHPLHSWTAESTDFIAVILTDEERSDISQVAVTAKIASFDSKNANRDSHTIEITEAIKYPAVSFASNSIVKKGDGKLLVTGNLIFHGVTKSISFDAETALKGKSLVVTGGFTIKMTEYDIERPSLMGMATDDGIEIEFETVF